VSRLWTIRRDARSPQPDLSMSCGACSYTSWPCMKWRWHVSPSSLWEECTYIHLHFLEEGGKEKPSWLEWRPSHMPSVHRWFVFFARGLRCLTRRPYQTFSIASSSSCSWPWTGMVGSDRAVQGCAGVEHAKAPGCWSHRLAAS